MHFTSKHSSHCFIVTVHRTLNSCRGVISEPELQYVPEAEILDNLKDQNIIDVRRVSVYKNDNRIPTRH